MADGLHIATLIEVTVWKYAPELIKQGRLSLILPPLFGTWVNKQFIPLYTEKLAGRYRNQNYEITRFKGLGEMDSDELGPVIRNPLEYVVKPPANDEEEKSIVACITNTAVKHALCDEVESFNLNKIIELCQV
jgi:DNA gyrase/topoisomerase IV subunit B